MCKDKRSQRKPSQVSKPKHSFYKMRGGELLGWKLRGYCCSQLDSHHAAFVFGTLSNIQSGSVGSTSFYIAAFSKWVYTWRFTVDSIFCLLHTQTHTLTLTPGKKDSLTQDSHNSIWMSFQRTLVKRTTRAGCVSAFTKLDVSLGSLTCTSPTLDGLSLWRVNVLLPGPTGTSTALCFN